MNACSTLGCNNTVSKPNHPVCLKCWKEARSTKTTSESKIAPAAEPAVSPRFLSATRLSEHFNVRRYEVNPTLAELGLLEKVENGWKATSRGLAIGAQERFDARKNSKYVIWSTELLENSVFQYAFQTIVRNANPEPAQLQETEQNSESGFRDNLRDRATYRTSDGHWVRSRAEALIDNWLYATEVVHAYERRVPITAELYCDFFIPQGRVYIEYWGYENDPKYTTRKEAKIKLYQSNGLNLIELKNEHIEQLDDYLPLMLRKFGIKVD